MESPLVAAPSLGLAFCHTQATAADDETRYSEHVTFGLLLACLLFGARLLMAVSLCSYFHRTYRTGMRVKAAVIHALYWKSLRISTSSRKNYSTGKCVAETKRGRGGVRASFCTR